MIQPMLAAKLENVDTIRFPVLATPKFDGIRCLKLEGKVLSRSFKPIRNRHIHSLVSTLPDGVDGELILAGADFSDSQSGIMSADGKPDFRFCIFDVISRGTYSERVLDIPEAPFVDRILPVLINNVHEFLAYEEQCLKQGYEGVVFRSPNSPYKFGRSSLREGWMVKWKRVEDSDAVIIGFVEAMQNCNTETLDAFGHVERKGGQAMMFPKNTLGGFLVRDVKTNVEFSVGTGKGLTHALRQRIWDNQSEYLGRTIVYTYQKVGVKDRPRFPSFKGFREDL